MSRGCLLPALLVACQHPEPPPATCTPTEEVQDGIDNDCDGAIDEDAPVTTGYFGCGASTVGGGGGRQVWVDTLADDGPGSLRAALALDEPRRIGFTVAGTITLASPLSITTPDVTVDGASAPAPGITLTPPPAGVALEVRETSQVILSHLRVLGDWAVGGPAVDGDGAIQLIGLDAPTTNVVVDHVTISRAADVGLDVWGLVDDVTVSWTLVHSSRHPTTISYHPEPFYPRDCISLHHDAWVQNSERNPQLRADSRRIDVAQNLIADWGPPEERQSLGLTVRAEPGEPTVSANLHDNLFVADEAPEAAIVYGEAPGPEDDGGPRDPVPEGTRVAGSRMGALWVADNHLPAEAIDVWSTLDAPLDVPTVPLDPDLAVNLPAGVGCRDRTSVEGALLDALAHQLE